MTKTTLVRPTGLSVLAVLAIATGLLAITLGVVGSELNLGVELSLGVIGELFSFAPAPFTFPGSMYGFYGNMGFTAAAGALVSALVGALYLMAGIGAWRVRPWAWFLGLGIIAINLFGLISTAYYALSDNWSPLLLVPVLAGIVHTAALTFYLTRPHVKAALGR